MEVKKPVARHPTTTRIAKPNTPERHFYAKIFPQKKETTRSYIRENLYIFHYTARHSALQSRQSRQICRSGFLQIWARSARSTNQPVDKWQNASPSTQKRLQPNQPVDTWQNAATDEQKRPTFPKNHRKPTR